MSPSALGRGCDTADMDGYIPGHTGVSPPAGEREATRAGLDTGGERTGSHSSDLGNPRAQGMPPGLPFWLLSACWPRFTVSCAGGLSLHRGGRRAQQPLSCILLGPPQGRRISLVAPRGEVASPRPVLGAPGTMPVCATLEASGNRVGDPTRSARSRKAPVPTGGRVSRRRQTVGSLSNGSPHPPHPAQRQLWLSPESYDGNMDEVEGNGQRVAPRGRWRALETVKTEGQAC